MHKLNLGCGTNRLHGWLNHDADVDITKPLPWPDFSASHIVIEHCVEHVPHKSAIAFFQEALRVLAPGGVLRVTVPSLEQIADSDDADYYRFTQKWQPLGPTKRGAMHAIIYAHGHEMIWNARLMRDVLHFAGFDDVRQCPPGQSEDPVLRGVEGHGSVIGHKFNEIESCTHEARKAGALPEHAASKKIAIVVGGAEGWDAELAQARALCAEAGVEPVLYAVNDHVADLSDDVVACSLHVDKLSGWLRERARRGYPAPLSVWSFQWDERGKRVTNKLADVGGSTGLFAFLVAREQGHDKIVVCGVPMTQEGKHYVRHAQWNSCELHWERWHKYSDKITPHLRSTSGRTAEKYGRPTIEWMTGGQS